MKESSEGLEIKVPFNKWKKTPPVFFCIFLSLWCALIDLGHTSDLLVQIPFLITGIISIHVLFFMVFAKWKVEKDDKSFSIITGWAYIWWGVEVPTGNVKTIELAKVPKLKNKAREEDHFKVEAKKMKVKCCWLLSPFRKKRPDYIDEYGFGKFMTDAQKIKLIDLLKIEQNKKVI